LNSSTSSNLYCTIVNFSFINVDIIVDFVARIKWRCWPFS